ncbi:MAG: MFS transporter [Patescibacteria group bacterium]
MDKIFLTFKQSKLLNVLFISNIFLSFHYYLLVYINSSFLNNFFSDTQISALYIIGSLLNTIFLLNISKILNRFGNYRIAMVMIFLEIIATIGMIVANAPFLIGLYFIIHQIAVSLVGFNLDVFLETTGTDEKRTGEIRGMYMTLANITIIISTGLVALLLRHNVFWHVYLLSVVFLIPFYYLIYKYFKYSKEEPIQHIHIRGTLLYYMKDKNLYNIFISQFMLQLFYAYMVIYTPLHLINIGFSWTQIGLMFAIMLLPFVIFEIPIGDLADEKYGEKEFMTIGFVIMGIATMLMSFITIHSFWAWAVILFITRVGASFVEITSDSYFFKHVDQQKTNIISFYRITRPVSFIVAPILATVTLGLMIPLQYTFILIGACMIVATHFTLALEDTK